MKLLRRVENSDLKEDLYLIKDTDGGKLLLTRATIVDDKPLLEVRLDGQETGEWPVEELGHRPLIGPQHRYEGRQGGSGATVCKDGILLSLGPSLALCDHSARFSWGYGGSGPAQLALALLLDVTGNPALALNLYQEFKREVVAKLGWNWTMTTQEIQDWVTQHARQGEVCDG